MRAMLVTAGFGTRLAPLTDLMPKPAVPVANKPLAWFALDHLHRAGVRDFVLNTHHLADVLRAEMEHHAPRDARLSFVHETEILGTGGGIRNAWHEHRDEPLLTMNGKLLFAPDIAKLVDAHETSGAIATMVLQPMPAASSFGAIDIDAEGRVRRILDQPAADAGKPLRRMMFTGVQLLHPRAFTTLPANGCVIRDGYQHWLARGEHIQSVVDLAPFQDAGISADHYWRANMSLLDRTHGWPNIDPDSANNLIATEATIGADASLTRSVVAPYATVAPGIRLDRCILWPGVEVTTDLTDTVVLPDGRLISIAG